MSMSPSLEPPQGNFFSGRGGGGGGGEQERERERNKERKKKERNKEIADNKIPEQTAG
jgi:hypothetical protein